MVQTVFVLNGPNLNALGKREPGIYGGDTLDGINAKCVEIATELGAEVEFRQTNHEGSLVDWLHEANESAVGVVLNAGAYTHRSIALHDAIRAIQIPVIEIHLSNVHAREEFRHESMIAPVALGVICGFGSDSYTLAIRAITSFIKNKN